MTNSERVALLRATGEEILSGEVVVDDREGQLMVWAADTIATLTRERDEARANAERFRQSLYATEESSAAQHARAERLQAVRDDCVRKEAALIADRDAWKAKAEAAEQRLAEFNAYLADAPTVGRQCPLCRADAELPPLPDGWRHEIDRWGRHVFSARGQTTAANQSGWGPLTITATSSTVLVGETKAVKPADLLIVLCHAEAAHQQLKEGK